MEISNQEFQRMAEVIQPLFDAISAEYDLRKYPAAAYSDFCAAFSELSPSRQMLEDAFKWKWGHWGKPDYPMHHKNLIAEIQTGWPLFVNSGAATSPEKTFVWWHHYLSRNTTYITEAFITHLVHSKRALPIIDQHNFRAMNNLIRSQKPFYSFKKKPSSWQDIQDLSGFMQGLAAQMGGREFPDIDRFLMMYGRNHVSR